MSLIADTADMNWTDICDLTSSEKIIQYLIYKKNKYK